MKKWMTFLCILLLCSSQTLLSVSAAPAKSVSSTPRQTQITVRTATNFKTESDVKKFVQLASKYKISVIYLNVKQAAGNKEKPEKSKKKGFMGKIKETLDDI